MNIIKLKKAAKKAVEEWREWHKPQYGSFPSDGLISAMHDLDKLFPGKTANGIVDENEGAKCLRHQ
jgi:hypothetical protein